MQGVDSTLVVAIMGLAGICLQIMWSVINHAMDNRERIRIAAETRAHAEAEAQAVQDRLEERAAVVAAQQNELVKRTEAIMSAANQLQRGLDHNTQISTDAFQEANQVNSKVARALQTAAANNPQEALGEINTRLTEMQGTAAQVVVDRAADDDAAGHVSRASLQAVADTGADTNERVRNIESAQHPEGHTEHSP